MNNVIWTIGIIFSIAGMFLILNPTPNIAFAYSCSSSSSTHQVRSSSSVSGSSGSCATSSSSSSTADHLVIGTGSHFPPNVDLNVNRISGPGHSEAAASIGGGGSESSCEAGSANHSTLGSSLDSQQGSCSTHNP